MVCPPTYGGKKKHKNSGPYPIAKIIVFRQITIANLIKVQLLNPSEYLPTLAIWRSGDLAIWRSGDLAIWRSGDLMIWNSLIDTRKHQESISAGKGAMFEPPTYGGKTKHKSTCTRTV